jgi:hypothetical protein
MATKATLRRVFLVGVLAVVSAAHARGAGPYNFYSVTPCRLADTRLGFGFSGLSGPPALPAGSPRNFPIAGLCGVPTDAKAAALNVTVVSPTLEGFIKIWPSNLSLPAVSTINFAAGEPAIANGAIVPMALDQQGNTIADPQISVVYGTAVPGGTSHLILDVTGFFK